MSTLLLRLAGPLQSWGLTAKFDQRDTQRLPTKSAVVGLLACALGRRRDEDIQDLKALRMGVRADQEGELVRDFHIARPEKSPPYVTSRYYLSDAVFLVGLEGEDAMLEALEAALKKPAFPLFLGRRSCPPEGRLCLGIRKGIPLKEALFSEPWQAGRRMRGKRAGNGSLQVLLEVPPGTPGAFYLRDEPQSFDQARRQHGYRSLMATRVRLPDQGKGPKHSGRDETLHDAMMDWGD